MTKYLEQLRLESDELYHYGVKGMHWGVRKFAPASDGSVNGKYLSRKKMLRKARFALNQNAYQIANAEYRIKVSENRRDKYLKKNTARSMRKAQKEITDIQTHTKFINEGKKAINNTIKSMKQQKFDIASNKKQAMLYDRGKSTLGYFIAGPIGMVALTPRGEVENYSIKDKTRW